MHKYM